MVSRRSFLVVFFGAVILSLFQGSKAQTQEFACMDCQGSLFANKRDCYCGADADKVIACLTQKYPNYPFLNGGP